MGFEKFFCVFIVEANPFFFVIEVFFCHLNRSSNNKRGRHHRLRCLWRGLRIDNVEICGMM